MLLIRVIALTDQVSVYANHQICDSIRNCPTHPKSILLQGLSQIYSALKTNNTCQEWRHSDTFFRKSLKNINKGINDSEVFVITLKFCSELLQKQQLYIFINLFIAWWYNTVANATLHYSLPYRVNNDEMLGFETEIPLWSKIKVQYLIKFTWNKCDCDIVLMCFRCQ